MRLRLFGADAWTNLRKDHKLLRHPPTAKQPTLVGLPVEKRFGALGVFRGVVESQWDDKGQTRVRMHEASVGMHACMRRTVTVSGLGMNTSSDQFESVLPLP